LFTLDSSDDSPEINWFVSRKVGSCFLEFSSVDGSDKWNSDVLSTVWNSVSLGSTGSFLKVFIEFLSIALIFLWESGLSTFSSCNLIKSDFFIFNFFKDVIEELHCKISDNWDGNSLGTIRMFETLISTVSFSETSEVLYVFFISGTDSNLTTAMSFYSFVKSDLVFSNFFEDVIEEGNINFSDNWDLKGLGTISMGETLSSTGSFLETSELLDVLLVVGTDGNLTADFTGFDFVKSLLGGLESFTE